MLSPDPLTAPPSRATPPPRSPALYCLSARAPQSNNAKRLPRDLARRRHLGHALGPRDIVQRGADQRGVIFCECGRTTG